MDRADTQLALLRVGEHLRKLVGELKAQGYDGCAARTAAALEFIAAGALTLLGVENSEVVERAVDGLTLLLNYACTDADHRGRDEQDPGLPDNVKSSSGVLN